MKIELSQSGGYAGDTIKIKDISTENIPAGIKAKLTKLISSSDFFNIKEIPGSQNTGKDLLTYNLKISNSNDQSNEITFDEKIGNTQLLNLLSLIKSL